MILSRWTCYARMSLYEIFCPCDVIVPFCTYLVLFLLLILRRPPYYAWLYCDCTLLRFLVLVTTLSKSVPKSAFLFLWRNTNRRIMRDCSSLRFFVFVTESSLRRKLVSTCYAQIMLPEVFRPCSGAVFVVFVVFLWKIFTVCSIVWCAIKSNMI